tara:strand:- start:883 stop:1581 length:699 start_codon:yes stop_codon:yes gene_type:complete
MKKPIIGITLDSEKEKTYSNFPWYALRENYLTSLTKFNAIPFPLLHEKKYISDFCDLIDGLIITGGNFDIDPKLYKASNIKSKNIKNKRTNFEIGIFKNFFKYNKPILGICGGAQVINVACGGTLIQDLKKEPINHEQINPRNQTSHNVNILENTKLHKICGTQKIKVNSAHHQSMKKIGKELKISCKANDGVIEGIEHKKHKWCIGLQWHPEFLITPYDLQIIKNFIDESK